MYILHTCDICVTFWFSALQHADAIRVQDRSPFMSSPTCKSQTLGRPALVGGGFGEEDAAMCK